MRPEAIKNIMIVIAKKKVAQLKIMEKTDRNLKGDPFGTSGRGGGGKFVGGDCVVSFGRFGSLCSTGMAENF